MVEPAHQIMPWWERTAANDVDAYDNVGNIIQKTDYQNDVTDSRYGGSVEERSEWRLCFVSK